MSANSEETRLEYKSINNKIQELVSGYFSTKYEATIAPHDVIVNLISGEIKGDYSVVLFPYLKRFQTNPDALGEDLGSYLVEQGLPINEREVVRGFLNLTLEASVYSDQLTTMVDHGECHGLSEESGKTYLVEFCSPNTNKPLHLGHIRNILIGWSMSRIFEACGHQVVKVQIVNDRGIAICKSMVAWQELADGATPKSTKTKGDHFVGDYYVQFEKLFQAEYSEWKASETAQAIYDAESKEEETSEDFYKRYKNLYFNQYSAIGEKAKTMLQKWEQNDTAVIDLWKQMNGWVYAGFDETYDALGVSFDKLYFESDTYLLGKEIVDTGLQNDKLYKKDDGSIWIDLTADKLDQKLLMRSDGTSVYITQDIGTALQRYEDYQFDQCVYVVADEQDYHFKALFSTMKALDYDFHDKLYHLSYGMVDLPTGKMKSREGTVVDADDLVVEVIDEATLAASNSHNLAELSSDEKAGIFEKIGLGALKYFMLKVNAKKRMTFDPEQSVDMQGQTAPYIQNAYVRIKSVLAKSGDQFKIPEQYVWQGYEKSLIILLDQFPRIVKDAAVALDPSQIANYAYDLAKEYHKFYSDVRILSAETEEAKSARLSLSHQVSLVLFRAMFLLGIDMPEKM